MPFRSGAISYRRFAVSGSTPNLLDHAVFESLREHALGELDPIRPGEVHVGWTAGRHLFDRAFDYERTGFGSGMLLGFRCDTVRIPPEIKKAYVAMAEDARLVPSKDGGGAYLPRSAKKEARDEALRRLEEEIGEGRYRRPKHTPVWWDFSRATMYAPITADTEVQALRRLAIDSLEATIAPRTAGGVALDFLAKRGRTNDYDDLRAEALSSAPPEIELAREDGSRASADRPELPWTANEPQDFLGNLFLLWLWWHCDAREGVVATDAGEVAIVIDKALDLECAWGLSGRTSIRGDAPTRRAEAARAVQLGKWPRKIGLTVSQFGRVWECALKGDRFEVSALKLPKPEDKPASIRQAVEERLDSFATFDTALVAMYEAFVAERCSPSWPTRRAEMRAWIGELGATRKPVAVGV
ncbi:MAG: hypothetical protein RIS86_509 [Planctomycetota bacterium]|jgi:hypothetical protein